MHTLRIKVQPQAWQLFAARKIDPVFREFSKKVWVRDDYTCQFCGFQAQDYQEITNLDDDYRNNKLSNLVTTCCFCCQCMFLESIDLQGEGGGTLICLPEINQANLNSLCHVLFCAIANETGYKSVAQSIYRDLKLRSQVIEKKFGEGTSNPSVFGQLIAEMKTEKNITEQKIEELLQDVRLLPSHAKFRKQIEHWSKAVQQDAAVQEQNQEQNGDE